MMGLPESLVYLCLGAAASVGTPPRVHPGAPPRLCQSAAPAPAQPPASSPVSGYMDFHYNEPTDATPGVLDFHRFVLLFTHSFSDRLRFVSELELAHGIVEGGEEGGEL